VAFSPMAKYRMAQWSAILSLVGALLVFLSFQATSSDFFLTNLKNGDKALCVGQTALVVWASKNNGLAMGVAKGCADVADTPKVAVVTVEFPLLSYLGWLLLFIAFFLQFLSIEKPSFPQAATARLNSRTNPHTGLPHSKK
jgi:hypothetical protein